MRPQKWLPERHTKRLTAWPTKRLTARPTNRLAARLKKDWLLNRRKDWQRDFEFQPKNGVLHDLQNLFRKKFEMRLHELQSLRLGMREAKEIEEKQEREIIKLASVWRKQEQLYLKNRKYNQRLHLSRRWRNVIRDWYKNHRLAHAMKMQWDLKCSEKYSIIWYTYSWTWNRWRFIRGDVNIGGVIKGGNKRLIPVLKVYSFDNNNTKWLTARHTKRLTARPTKRLAARLKKSRAANHFLLLSFLIVAT